MIHWGGPGSLSVSTGLLFALGIWVLYTRLKSLFDSNIPIIFYVIAAIYANMYPDALPPLLVYCSFALGALLRFEFMSSLFARMIMILEMLVLLLILYDLLQVVLSGY